MDVRAISLGFPHLRVKVRRAADGSQRVADLSNQPVTTVISNTLAAPRPMQKI